MDLDHAVACAAGAVIRTDGKPHPPSAKGRCKRVSMTKSGFVGSPNSCFVNVRVCSSNCRASSGCK